MSFDIAVDQTLDHEGTWSNDPNDTGRETVFGVSRGNFSNWAGWKIVDQTNVWRGYQGFYTCS